MTKTELQSALAEATQTEKRFARVFLDAPGALAYKEIKKTGEFVLPGFDQLSQVEGAIAKMYHLISLLYSNCLCFACNYGHATNKIIRPSLPPP